MLWRKAEKHINEWIASGTSALLVTGARQIGKTYLIRHALEASEFSWVEFNLIDRPEIIELIDRSKGHEDLLLRLSAATDQELIPGQTIIFLDEIQRYKEIVTKIKFLVDEGSFRYILSGSLLGVELGNITSAPVGYLSLLTMYPMDFYEFSVSAGLSADVLDYLQTCYNDRATVDDVVHGRLMDLFYIYLIIGGMPQAVQTYVDSNNIQSVRKVQTDIRELYYLDFTQYAAHNALKIRSIFDCIPAELNKQNKRFTFTHLNKELRFERYENSFLWLANAGVALPAYIAECASPLEQNRSTNMFKLFMNDVGMLDAFYPDSVRIRILNKDRDINNGALFENAAAQQLTANGFSLYYYKSKKLGEVDFLIESDGYPVPVEIKSGKNYYSHSALNNLLASPDHHIQEAYVFSGGNIEVAGKIHYLPIYMLMFLKEPELEIKSPRFDFSDVIAPR